METKKYENIAKPLVLACRYSVPDEVLIAFENRKAPDGFWEVVHNEVGFTPEHLLEDGVPDVADVAIVAVAALIAAIEGEPEAETYYEAVVGGLLKIVSLFSRALVESMAEDMGVDFSTLEGD